MTTAATAIVFTDSVCAAARSDPRASEFLVYRWALFDGSRGDSLRRQLEAAAALVPEAQRDRVLGPLHCANRDQVLGTANMLFLAKALRDLGWCIEYEPCIADGTPDLRVCKNAAEFIVEIKQVIGDARLPNERELERVVTLLRTIRTRTPIWIDALHVPPGASLRGFRTFVENALKAHPTGRQIFRDDNGVLIAFALMPDLMPEGKAEIGAYGGYQGEPTWVDDHDAVEAAVQEKLRRYRCPLIVAIDMVDCMDPFTTAEDVICGREVIRIPIDVVSGGPAGTPHLARNTDAIVRGRDRDAARARERLQALLPFQICHSDRGVSVQARVLANPYRPESTLAEFDPIPVLTVTARDERTFTMEYLRGGTALCREDRDRWGHVP